MKRERERKRESDQKVKKGGLKTKFPGPTLYQAPQNHRFRFNRQASLKIGFFFY